MKPRVNDIWTPNSGVEEGVPYVVTETVDGDDGIVLKNLRNGKVIHRDKQIFDRYWVYGQTQYPKVGDHWTPKRGDRVGGHVVVTHIYSDNTALLFEWIGLFKEKSHTLSGIMAFFDSYKFVRSGSLGEHILHSPGTWSKITDGSIVLVCSTCGVSAAMLNTSICTPDPTWRSAQDKVVAHDMDLKFNNVKQVERKRIPPLGIYSPYHLVGGVIRIR